MQLYSKKMQLDHKGVADSMEFGNYGVKYYFSPVKDEWAGV